MEAAAVNRYREKNADMYKKYVGPVHFRDSFQIPLMSASF